MTFHRLFRASYVGANSDIAETENSDRHVFADHLAAGKVVTSWTSRHCKFTEPIHNTQEQTRCGPVLNKLLHPHTSKLFVLHTTRGCSKFRGTQMVNRSTVVNQWIWGPWRFGTPWQDVTSMLYFFRSLNKQIHHIEINFEWFVPQFGTIEKKDANHRHLVKDASSHEGTKSKWWFFSQTSSLQSSHGKKRCQIWHMKEGKKSGDFQILKHLLKTSLMNLSVGSVAGENDGRCSTALTPWWPCRLGWGLPTRPPMVVGNFCLWVWNRRLRVQAIGMVTIKP